MPERVKCKCWNADCAAPPTLSLKTVENHKDAPDFEPRQRNSFATSTHVLLNRGWLENTGRKYHSDFTILLVLFTPSQRGDASSESIPSSERCRKNLAEGWQRGFEWARDWRQQCILTWAVDSVDFPDWVRVRIVIFFRLQKDQAGLCKRRWWCWGWNVRRHKHVQIIWRGWHALRVLQITVY